MNNADNTIAVDNTIAGGDIIKTINLDNYNKTINSKTINSKTINSSSKKININNNNSVKTIQFDDDTSSLESIRVYTDGSCINNGKKNARGGVGVWFGENDPRNISKKLNSVKPTNQSAELTAILMTLDLLNETLIRSNYIYIPILIIPIKCITRYCKYWVKNIGKRKMAIL